MAENTIITLTSPEGATLNTAGKYCEGNIEVVPKLQSKTATTGEIVTADDGYVGLESVDTNPVCEAGKKVFWDVYQQMGTRQNYANAFRDVGWNDNSYDPQYPLKGRTYTNAFYGSRITDTKVDVYIPGTIAGFTFGTCENLVTIRKLIVEEKTSFTMAFDSCTSLENIVIEGTIGQNGFDVSWSPLSKASLVSIVNALSSTTTGLTVTLRLDAVKKAFETSEGANDGMTSDEWLQLIATKPNWTINTIDS
jgi:hypothetical protein